MAVGYTTSKPIKTKEICFYGCGNQAHYQFENGRVCCLPDFRQCPGYKKRVSEAGRGKKAWNKGIPPNADTKTKIGLGNKGKKAVLYAHPVTTDQLCDYDCGNKANYVFSNGKKCCSTDYKACPGFIDRLNRIKKEKFPKHFEHIGTDEWTYNRVSDIVEVEGISIPIYIRNLIYEDLKERLRQRKV